MKRRREAAGRAPARASAARPRPAARRPAAASARVLAAATRKPAAHRGSGGGQGGVGAPPRSAWLEGPAFPRRPPAALRAGRAARAGEELFREGPLRSAQTPRSPEEHASEQPLFCQEASCAAACGPPQAALALAAGRLRRAELLEFVRHNEGDGAALARWLDFASKTPALPVLGGEAAPGIFAAPGADEPGGSGCAGALACFCSAGCRDQWLRGGHLAAAASRGCVAARALLRRAEEAGGPDPTLRRNLTVMTAEALLEAARPWLADLRAGRLGRAHRGVLGALAPILGAAAGASPLRRGALPTRALASAHSLLLDAVVEVASGAGGWQLQASGRRLRRQWAGLVLPRGLFEGVLAVLDKCAWSLDGSTLPSPLARYCGALRGGGGDGAAEAEAVAAIGPVVRALCEQQDALAEDSEEEGEEAGSAGEAAAAEAPPGAIPLPPPERARGMRPVLVPHLLGAEEIALVKQVSQDAAARDHHKHAAGSQWRTRYLQAGGAFRRLAAALLEKLRGAALEAALGPGGWGLLRGMDAARLRPRVLEHHLVSAGGALPDPTHFDGGSLLTLDVMLSEPGRDFGGGEFCTTEADGTHAHHSFGQGDALVFVSHKPHHVRPVTWGLRQVLILELWDGEERRCDHRCPLHRGRCPDEDAPLASEGPAADGAAPDAADALAVDAERAFAATSWYGLAFFPKLARVMSQSDRALARRRAASGGGRRTVEGHNVEAVFDSVRPVVSVRALRDIGRGELLVIAQGGHESEDSDGSGDSASNGEDSEGANAMTSDD